MRVGVVVIMFVVGTSGSSSSIAIVVGRVIVIVPSVVAVIVPTIVPIVVTRVVIVGVIVATIVSSIVARIAPVAPSPIARIIVGVIPRVRVIIPRAPADTCSPAPATPPIRAITTDIYIYIGSRAVVVEVVVPRVSIDIHTSCTIDDCRAVAIEAREARGVRAIDTWLISLLSVAL
jgi:hypothetical protein